MFDHVHLLVRLPPSLLVSEFIGQVKGASAYRVNRDIQPEFKLRWQEGYGVLTLREAELPAVSRYIDNQERHHQGGRVSDLLETIDCLNEDDWQPPNKM
jgi:REP element-mobilizing transposase RayT